MRSIAVNRLQSIPEPAARAQLLVLGKGAVASELLSILASGAAEVSTLGIVDSERALLNTSGVSLLDWREQLSQAPRWGANLALLLDRLGGARCPVLVDCTAADNMEQLYVSAFRRGIHVVTANKRPLTIARADRQRLIDTARAHRVQFRYETTVGAALPILEPLKDLLATGDTIFALEGSFSGTLGFVCDEVMRGVPLSGAVAEARRRGYTEPNPAEDLSGRDVARKGLILAREIGLSLDFDDVHIDPFVPSELLTETNPDRFVRSLKDLDVSWLTDVHAARSSGRVLRYLARVDAGTRRVTVGRVWVNADHPAARLRGSESFVAFTTRRYKDAPLCVQGPGAGAEVTAGGVLADVLRVEKR